MTVSALVAGLCDDAAVFPPGNAPVAAAVSAHHAHQDSGHAELLGPFVFPESRLAELAALPVVGRVLDVSLTVPDVGAAPTAIAELARCPGTRLVAVEVAVPDGHAVESLAAGLDQLKGAAPGVAVHVEVPRGGRASEILECLSRLGVSAKFRTGGVVAEAYPSEDELAESLCAAVAVGVPFKATAGLHHAVRNTDPDTGFEQHGFLNLLAATHRAASGAGPRAVTAALADRDGERIAAALAVLSADEATALRRRFRSFGTCSIDGPLADLVDLGLVDEGVRT